MGEQWTKLKEYMKKMEEELSKPNYFSKNLNESEEEEKKSKQRSAKYLWLA